MLRFRNFLIERFDIIQAMQNTPPLQQHVISPLETHYTMPLTDTHKLRVMFNPIKKGPADESKTRTHWTDRSEVHWKLDGENEFSSKRYTPQIHKRVMGAILTAIETHRKLNPQIRVVSGTPTLTGLDRSYERTLKDYAEKTPGVQYNTSTTSLAAKLFGTRQYNLVFQ